MKVLQIGRVGDIGGSSNVELYGIIFQLDSSHLTGSSLVGLVIMPHQISGMSRMEDATQRFCQIVGTMKLSHQYSTASVMAATAGSSAIVLVSKGSRAAADNWDNWGGWWPSSKYSSVECAFTTKRST